jgi:hypothetical protein
MSRRIATTNPNLLLWHEMMGTDATLAVGGDAQVKVVKGFKRGGGFGGTAINPTYVMMRLTAAFGPVGQGWGYEVIADDVIPGGHVMREGVSIGQESVQRTRIRFWWRSPEQLEANKAGGGDEWGSYRNSFDQVGQTMFVEYRKTSGVWFTDEEAWKKSLTDAITKAASHLGIGADIHMGLWDDNKYVATREEAAGEQATEQAANENVAGATQAINQAEALIGELKAAPTIAELLKLRGRAIALRPILRRFKLDTVDAQVIQAGKDAAERIAAAEEAADTA